MFGVKRIWRRNVDGVQLLKLAHRLDGVESLNAKLRAVLFARVLSEEAPAMKENPVVLATACGKDLPAVPRPARPILIDMIDS